MSINTIGLQHKNFYFCATVVGIVIQSSSRCHCCTTLDPDERSVTYSLRNTGSIAEHVQCLTQWAAHSSCMMAALPHLDQTSKCLLRGAAHKLTRAAVEARTPLKPQAAHHQQTGSLAPAMPLHLAARSLQRTVRRITALHQSAHQAVQTSTLLLSVQKPQALGQASHICSPECGRHGQCADVYVPTKITTWLFWFGAVFVLFMRSEPHCVGETCRYRHLKPAFMPVTGC